MTLPITKIEGWASWRQRAVVLFSAALLAGPFLGTIGAEDGPALRELWVPTARLGPVLKQMPEAVMLSREEFERLRQSAGDGWLREDEGGLPEALLLRSAEGRLHDLGEHVRLDVDLVFESTSAEWTAVPLGLPVEQLLSVTRTGGDEAAGEEAGVTATLVRGQVAGAGEAAAGTELLLVAQGEGGGVLRLELLLPVEMRGQERHFLIPACPAPQGLLRMDRAAAGVDAPSFEVTDGGIVAVWDGNPVRWRLIDAVVPELEQSASQVEMGTQVEISPGWASHRAEMKLRHDLQTLPETLLVTLPPGSRSVRVSGQQVRNWDLDERALQIRFRELSPREQRRHVVLELDYEVPLNAADEDGLTEYELTLPEVEGFDRVTGRLVLRVGNGLRLMDVVGHEGLRLNALPLLQRLAAEAIAAEAAGDEAAAESRLWISQTGFTAQPEAIKVRLRRERQRIAADLDTRIHLTSTDLQLTHTLQVRPLEGDLVFSEVVLPEGEELLAVEMDGAQPEWRLEESRLRIRWPQGIATDGSGKVTIRTRRLPEGWLQLGQEPFELSFKTAQVSDVERLGGYVAVDYESSLDVQVTGETGLERRDAATSPISGRLAWFRLDDFQLQLEATRRAPELSARVIQHAMPLAGSLEIEGGLELDIRHSGLRALEVDLEPEFATALRWNSNQISEERLDEETGRWTLTFREEIAGGQLLRWRMSLAHPEMETNDSGRARFSNRLPVMKVPSARRFEGQVVVEANTDTEVSFETAGLDPLDTLGLVALPGYQPRHRAVAAYRYRGDQWRLELTGVRHNTQPLTTLVIRDLKLVSVLGIDEPQRHQLTADVLASGEQFIGFGLPAEARILSVVVAGEPARPIKGEDGEVRVELPPSQGGEVRSQILLAWEQPPAKRRLGRIALVPPTLPEGAVLLASNWQVHVPDGYSYRGFEGNLRPDFEPHRVGFVRSIVGVLGGPVINRARPTHGAEDMTLQVAATFEPEEAAEALDDMDTAELPPAASDPNPAPESLRAEIEIIREFRGMEDMLSAEPETPQGMGLKVDRAGVETLAFDLPVTGRVFGFSGHEAPGELTFVARSWESQMRWAWLMVLAGILLFWRFAMERPLVTGLLGWLLLACVPVLLFGTERWAWFNAIQLGWLAAMGVTLFIRLISRMARVLARDPGPDAIARGATTLLLALALTQGGAEASEPVSVVNAEPAAVSGPVRVVVPYDPAEGMAATAERPVYLDRATFERLWQAAHRQDPDLPPSQQGARLPQGIEPGAVAHYEVELEEERLRLRAQLQVVTGEPWTRLSLGLAESALSSLTLNGEPVGLTGGGVVIEHAGLHRLEYTTEIKMDRGWQSVRIPVVPSSSAGLSVLVDDGWVGGLTLTGDRPLLQQPRPGGGRSWTGAVGAMNELTLQRVAETQVAAMRAVTAVDLNGSLRLEAGHAVYTGELTYRFPGGRQDRFTLAWDDSWKLERLPVGDIRSWSLTEAEGGIEQLEFELAEPAENEFKMAFSMVSGESVELSSENPRAEVSGPRIGVGGARINRRIEILSGSDVRATPGPDAGAGWRRVASQQSAEHGRAAGAFVADGGVEPMKVAVEWQRLERKVDMELVYQIGRSQLETIALLDLEQTDGDIVSMTIDLEPGQVVQDVQGETLSGWFRSGDRLLLNFDPGVRGKVPVMVYLSQPREEAAAVALSPLSIRDWPVAGGRIDVVAHASVAVAVQSVDGAGRVEDPSVGETGQSATTVVAPFEHKRTFLFGEDGFGLVAELQEVPPQIEASWTQVVEARDGYATLRALIEFNVRRGAMDSVRLLVPAGLPTPDVSGPLVREVRRIPAAESGVDPGSEPDVLEVTFQKDVLDGTRLEVAMELPYAIGAAGDGARRLDLPLPEVAVELTGDRFLSVSYLTQDEVKVDAPQARTVPVAEAPFLPDDFQGDRILAFVPGPARARLEIAELSTTAGREAVVTLAELNSAVRENGDLWTTATYQMLNRSLQFLPVELPEGAELISVRVDGVGVRADRGESGGLILVPLIQTDPGQVAYPVELTYRQSIGKRLGTHARAVFEDPDLPGISVQRTLWNVSLPDDFRVVDRDGNMEPVTAEITGRERVSASMSELSRLNKVIEKGSGYGYATRMQAVQTATELKSKIEQDTMKLSRPGRGVYDGKSVGPVDKLEQDLERITVELTENRVALASEVEQARSQQGGFLQLESERPWYGWNYNGADLQRQDQRRLEDRERTREELGRQTLINDNLAIPAERLQPQWQAKEGERDQILKGLRFGTEAIRPDRIQSTGNARGQLAQQQAELTPPEARESQIMNRADLEERRQLLELEPQSRYRDTAGDRAGDPFSSVDGRIAEREAGQRLGLVGPGQAPAAVTAESLRGTGKVSLEIDFPRTSNSVHYRKNHDHARLVLEVRRDTESPRLQALIGLFFGLLGWGVLAGVARKWRRGW